MLKKQISDLVERSNRILFDIQTNTDKDRILCLDKQLKSSEQVSIVEKRRFDRLKCRLQRKLTDLRRRKVIYGDDDQFSNEENLSESGEEEHINGAKEDLIGQMQNWIEKVGSETLDEHA